MQPNKPLLSTFWIVALINLSSPFAIDQSWWWSQIRRKNKSNKNRETSQSNSTVSIHHINSPYGFHPNVRIVFRSFLDSFDCRNVLGPTGRKEGSHKSKEVTSTPTLKEEAYSILLLFRLPSGLVADIDSLKASLAGHSGPKLLHVAGLNSNLELLAEDERERLFAVEFVAYSNRGGRESPRRRTEIGCHFSSDLSLQLHIRYHSVLRDNYSHQSFHRLSRENKVEKSSVLTEKKEARSEKCGYVNKLTLEAPNLYFGPAPPALAFHYHSESQINSSSQNPGVLTLVFTDPIRIPAEYRKGQAALLHIRERKFTKLDVALKAREKDTNRQGEEQPDDLFLKFHVPVGDFADYSLIRNIMNIVYITSTLLIFLMLVCL